MKQPSAPTGSEVAKAMTTYPAPIMPAPSGMRATTGRRCHRDTSTRPVSSVPGAPGAQDDAVRAVAAAEDLLGPDDLDRRDHRGAHERDGVRGEDAAHRRVAERMADAGAYAREPSLARVRMRGRKRAARCERDGHRGEQPRAHPQRRAHAPGRDDQATDGGADGEAERERDVQERVARVELAVGLEGGGHCTARQRAADERQDAVRRREGEHEREPRRGRQQRQRREDRGLDQVERGQHAADAEAVELRGGRRSDDGGHQQRAQPQGGRGQCAVRVVEDQQAERDGPEAPPELVERVGGSQAAEAGMAQGAKRDHSGGLSDRVPDGLMLRRRPDMPARGRPFNALTRALWPGWRNLRVRRKTPREISRRDVHCPAPFASCLPSERPPRALP